MKNFVIIQIRKLYLSKFNIFYLFTNLSNLYRVLRITWLEGHTQENTDQTEYLKNLSIDKKNILEIGFNAGHSAETFLSSNNYSKITSIDEASHDYIDYGYSYLSRKFRNRLRLFKIDSAEILTAIGSGEIFDLIFIDGYHSYEYAKMDMLNCKNFSNDKTVLVLDDYDDPNLSKAWDELVKVGIVNEIEIIRYGKHPSKSMGIGEYL
jgi:predicted O-methyltransferase YrrM